MYLQGQDENIYKVADHTFPCDTIYKELALQKVWVFQKCHFFCKGRPYLEKN